MWFSYLNTIEKWERERMGIWEISDSEKERDDLTLGREGVASSIPTGVRFCTGPTGGSGRHRGTVRTLLVLLRNYSGSFAWCEHRVTVHGCDGWTSKDWDAAGPTYLGDEKNAKQRSWKVVRNRIFAFLAKGLESVWNSQCEVQQTQTACLVSMTESRDVAYPV